MTFFYATSAACARWTFLSVWQTPNHGDILQFFNVRLNFVLLRTYLVVDAAVVRNHDQKRGTASGTVAEISRVFNYGNDAPLIETFLQIKIAGEHSAITHLLGFYHTAALRPYCGPHLIRCCLPINL